MILTDLKDAPLLQIFLVIKMHMDFAMYIVVNNIFIKMNEY